MAKNRDLKEIDIVSSELEELKRQTAELGNVDERAEKRKRSITILVVALAVIVIGAFIGAIIYVESQSPISYGPNALESEMTAEITKKHEERLAKIEEVNERREGLSYVGYKAEFNEDGDLVVDGYFRNYTGHEIYNIEGNITIETQTNENVGGAYFKFPKEDFGTLKNGYARPWRLIFDNDYVNVEITDLSSFTVTTEFKFYK